MELPYDIWIEISRQVIFASVAEVGDIELGENDYIVQSYYNIYKVYRRVMKWRILNLAGVCRAARSALNHYIKTYAMDELVREKGRTYYKINYYMMNSSDTKYYIILDYAFSLFECIIHYNTNSGGRSIVLKRPKSIFKFQDFIEDCLSVYSIELNNAGIHIFITHPPSIDFNFNRAIELECDNIFEINFAGVGVSCRKNNDIETSILMINMIIGAFKDALPRILQDSEGKERERVMTVINNTDIIVEFMRKNSN